MENNRIMVYHSPQYLQNFNAVLNLQSFEGNQVFTENDFAATEKRSVVLDIDDTLQEDILFLKTGRSKHNRVSIVGSYNEETNELSFGLARFRNYSKDELEENLAKLQKYPKEVLRTDVQARQQRINELRNIQKYRNFSKKVGIEVATSNLKTSPILVINPEIGEDAPSIGKQFSEHAQHLFLQTISDKKEKERVLRIFNYIEENENGKKEIVSFIETNSSNQYIYLTAAY
jgi:hypothetical protein